MGLSCVPVCLLGQLVAWQLARCPQGGQGQHWGQAGCDRRCREPTAPAGVSPELWQWLHLVCSSLFCAAGVNWDCWNHAPNIPSRLCTDPTVGCQRGGTRQELGLCAGGMDKRGWGSLDDSEAITGDLGEAPELSGEGDREGTGTVEGMWLIAGGRKDLCGGEAEQHQGVGTGPCSHRHW